MSAARKLRKDLSADTLFRLLYSIFSSIPDPRSGEVEIPLADVLMSAFAMFSLKDPSLLAFDQRRSDPNDNFRTIYGINRVPCDSQMRAVLDPVGPRVPACPVPRYLPLPATRQDAGTLCLSGWLLPCVARRHGIFLLHKIHCASCLEKHHRKALSLIIINCWGPRWYIPILRKSFRWHRSRSSSKTATPRTTASAMPPAAG